MSYEFSGGYKIRDQFAPHFMTFTVVDWIDLFSRKLYRDILIKNMQYCRQKKSLLIGGYVIMSNHLHVIWQSKTGKLSDTLRDFKSFCTKEMINAVTEMPESRRGWLLHMFAFHGRTTNQNDEYKLWKSGSHPEEITSEAFMKTKLGYIHENPVRAGIVHQAQDYIYSSASNYITGKGIMEIDFLF